MKDFRFNYKQNGAVLIVSLLILLVMTMIGVTAMQTTTMEERMAGNMNDRNIALESAEVAIRAAEAELETYVNTNDFGTSAWLHTLNNAPDNFDSATWDNTNSLQVAISGWGLSEGPRYFIEEVGTIEIDLDGPNIPKGYPGSNNLINKFRIVARGTGLSGTGNVYLQSYYGKHF